MTPQKPLLDKFALVVLGFALLTRLVVIQTIFWDTNAHADDAFNYIFVAYHTEYLGLTENSQYGAFVTSIAPLYPVYLIPFFKWIPANLPVVGGFPYLPIFEAISYQAARVGHTLLDTGTVLAVYVMATTIFGRTVGRVALVAQAFDPRALLANGPIATEPLFLALFTSALALFVLGTAREEWRYYPVAALLIGLSIMTRPVPIFFPIVLAGYLIWRSQYRQTALRVAGGMFAIMLLIIIPWNIRTGIARGTFFLPVSDSAFYHLWVTTVEDEYDLALQPQINEAHMQEFGKTDNIVPVDYLRAATRRIWAEPFAWLSGILRDTIISFLIPYGANTAMPRGAPSFSGTIISFLRGGTSIQDVLTTPHLPRRLILYLWHGWSLLFGAIGIGMSIAVRKPLSFVVLGWVLYGSAVVSVLLVEPRYVYPVLFGLNIFAAYASVQLLEFLRERRTPQARIQSTNTAAS